MHHKDRHVVRAVTTLARGMVLALLASGACMAQSYGLAESTTYRDDTSAWVLGQVERVAVNGVEAERMEFNARSLPYKSYRFGALQQIVTYHADGTVHTVADGRGITTTLNNWKRGTPQSITHHDSTGQSAVVNDDGTIASVTDEGGNKTCYAYDALGRLSQITYPSETQPGVCDTSAWAPTTITFSKGHPIAYGVPAGHWRQTTLTGNGRKVLVLDALWRPVVEQALDLGNVSATTSEVIKRYDSIGRLVFQSYPMNTGGQALYTDTALKGTRTAYDALGRVIRAEQDSEHGVLAATTRYLSDASGPYTLVTNPRQQQTLTRYQMFDQPGYDRPVQIDAPEGTRTTIVRDVFGKPHSMTRGPGQ